MEAGCGGSGTCAPLRFLTEPLAAILTSSLMASGLGPYPVSASLWMGPGTVAMHSGLSVCCGKEHLSARHLCPPTVCLDPHQQPCLGPWGASGSWMPST